MGLRDKFKKSTASATQQMTEQDKIVGLSNDNKRAGFLDIEEGDNYFRIFPGHPEEEEGVDPYFIHAKSVWWLPRMVEDDKGNKKIKRSPIFNAKTHAKANDRDIVDEYIKFAEKILKEEGLSQEEVDEEMLKIYGKYSKNPNKRIEGISSRPEWIMYAKKIEGSKHTFGRLSIGQGIKNGLNDVIAREQSDEPIGSESNNSLLDPDEGRAIIITKNPNASSPADYYKVSIDSSFDKATKQIQMYPLTDEDLEAFMEMPSIREMLHESYTRKDFSLALEGLRIFDEEQGFGVFDYDEFLEIAEELSQLYPEPKKSENQSSGKRDKDTEPDFESMSREELEIWADKYGIGVTEKTTDKRLIKRIQSKYEAEAEDGVEEVDDLNLDQKKAPAKATSKKKEQEPEEGVEEEDPAPEGDSQEETDAEARMRKIRERVKNRKK